MYRAGLSGRRARAYLHYHEAPRHRIRQDAVIPPAGRKFQNLNASINMQIPYFKNLFLSALAQK